MRRVLFLVSLLLLFSGATPSSRIVCDGVTDTTVALQSKINTSRTGYYGQRLSMPSGVCVLSNTVVIENVIGLALEGNNPQFRWNGPSDVPMLLLRDTNQVNLKNFTVLVSTAKPLHTVIQLENGSGTVVTPSKNLVENINIQCTNGGCMYGIRLAVGAGGDNNNDFNKFSNVSINNVSEACGAIEHRQSKSNVFEDFNCSNNGIGKYVIVSRGSYDCIRCQGNGSAVTDFFALDVADPITISNGNFENSARLLMTQGPSGAAFPITVRNTRWGMGNIAQDFKFIVYKFAGPLILQNNQFEGTSTRVPAQILFDPMGQKGSLISVGNYYGSNAATPFAGVQPLLSVGDIIHRADGSPIEILDAILPTAK